MFLFLLVNSICENYMHALNCILYILKSVLFYYFILFSVIHLTQFIYAKPFKLLYYNKKNLSSFLYVTQMQMQCLLFYFIFHLNYHLCYTICFEFGTKRFFFLLFFIILFLMLLLLCAKS